MVRGNPSTNNVAVNSICEEGTLCPYEDKEGSGTLGTQVAIYMVEIAAVSMRAKESSSLG